MKTFGKKVVLIGGGSVGSSYAFAMITQDVAGESAIINIAKSRVRAGAQDLGYDIVRSPSPADVKADEYEGCKDTDLVVITVGAPQKPSETRPQLVEKNAKIMKSIVKSTMDDDFDGYLLITVNLVDILTRLVKEYTGLPTERVIGSGTVLDSTRLQYLASQELGVASSSVDADIINEHGGIELAAWSQANVVGISVYDTLGEQTGSEAKAGEVYVNTRDAAYGIIQARGSTYYGIALALMCVSKAILDNESNVLNISIQLDGQYGDHRGVYLGVPTLVNQCDAIKTYEMPLGAEEQALFDKPVRTLEDTFDSIKYLLED